MGRHRKSGKREPNGKLSRRGTEQAKRNEAHLDGLEREERDTLAVGLAARQRVWGVPAPVSRDQMAGTAVGRYCLTGLITRQQYDAAQAYLDERDQYLQCIAAPRQPGAVDLNATKGQSVGLENVSRYHHIKAARETTDNAIRDKQTEIGMVGNLFGALDAVLINDVALDHLLGDLRTALNALVRRYGLDGRAAA